VNHKCGARSKCGHAVERGPAARPVAVEKRKLEQISIGRAGKWIGNRVKRGIREGDTRICCACLTPDFATRVGSFIFCFRGRNNGRKRECSIN